MIIKLRLLSAVLFLFGACASADAQEAVQRLQDVHKIYVGSFGNGDGADLIRSKVITRLVKSGRFEVVQVPEQADAILTGAGSLSTTAYYSASASQYGGSAQGGTRYHATAGVQLMNSNQKTLWADDVSNGLLLLSRSASSSLANRIVKNLLKAVSEGTNKK